MFSDDEIQAEFQRQQLPGGRHCAAQRGAFDAVTGSGADFPLSTSGAGGGRPTGRATLAEIARIDLSGLRVRYQVRGYA